MTTLIERANAAGIEAVVVSPRLGDFNEDLRLAGLDSPGSGPGADRAPGRRTLHGAGGIGRQENADGGAPSSASLG